MLFVIGIILGKYKQYMGILEAPIEKMGNIDGVPYSYLKKIKKK